MMSRCSRKIAAADQSYGLLSLFLMSGDAWRMARALGVPKVAWCSRWKRMHSASAGGSSFQ